MRYCPECEMLSVDAEAETCAACGKVLVSIDDIAPKEPDRLVVLTTCENPYQADVLRAALAGIGIDVLLEDVGLLASIWPVTAHGDVTSTRVMVHLKDAEAALDLLRQKNAGELAIDEDDVSEDDTPE